MSVGQDRSPARAIDHRDEPGIVGEQRVIGERDAAAVRGEADVADVSRAAIEHVADRELETLECPQSSNDGQVRAVGRPFRFTNLLGHDPRCAAQHGRASERACPDPAVEAVSE